jgi:cobalt/nickel transport system permease protein
MHLADGVLNVPTIVVTYAGAASLVAYSLQKIKEEEIPKISLMTGTFFAVSLFSFPIGPSCVHLLITGLLGVILGKRSPLAIFIGLLFQSIIFHHGGITALGANTVMLAIPALLSWQIYKRVKIKSPMKIGLLIGAVSTILVVVILVLILVTSQPLFAEGKASVVNFLILGHIPLVFIEAVITGSALQLIVKAKPDWLD